MCSQWVRYLGRSSVMQSGSRSVISTFRKSASFHTYGLDDVVGLRPQSSILPFATCFSALVLIRQYGYAMRQLWRFIGSYWLAFR